MHTISLRTHKVYVTSQNGDSVQVSVLVRSTVHGRLDIQPDEQLLVDLGKVGWKSPVFLECSTANANTRARLTAMLAARGVASYQIDPLAVLDGPDTAQIHLRAADTLIGINRQGVAGDAVHAGWDSLLPLHRTADAAQTAALLRALSWLDAAQHRGPVQIVDSLMSLATMRAKTADSPLNHLEVVGFYTWLRKLHQLASTLSA